MNPRRPIQVDPFFDGDRTTDGQIVPGPIAIAQPGYAPVDAEQSQHMRPGARGLRGTVIPRATMGGIPAGTQPHVTSDVMVNIDPHIPGQGTTIRLGDINEHMVNRATNEARNLVAPPSDIRGLRLQSSVIMRQMANDIREEQQEDAMEYEAPPVRQVPPQPQRRQQMQPVQPAPTDSYTIPQSPQFQPPQPRRPQMQQQRRSSPLSAFSNPQPMQQQREPRQIDFHEEQHYQQQAQSGPPQIAVLFEMENFGTMEARYHDVIIENGFMVLIYDTRHQTSAKYFPPVNRNQDQPRLAVQVAGTQEVYLVQTTGIQYVYGGNEHCILMIETVGEAQ